MVTHLSADELPQFLRGAYASGTRCPSGKSDGVEQPLEGWIAALFAMTLGFDAKSRSLIHRSLVNVLKRRADGRSFLSSVLIKFSMKRKAAAETL